MANQKCSLSLEGGFALSCCPRFPLRLHRLRVCPLTNPPTSDTLRTPGACPPGE